jgi:hypothetical protein
MVVSLGELFILSLAFGAGGAAVAVGVPAWAVIGAPLAVCAAVLIVELSGGRP